MAIIGSAEVEVRANVRKLGSDITDSFDNLEKQADKIADRMGKSISDSLKKSLDGLTIKVNIDDSILDDIIEIEEQLKSLSNTEIKIDLDDSAMAKVNTYHGKTLRYDIDLDTTYLDSVLSSITDQKVKIKVDNKELGKVSKNVEEAISGIPEKSRTVPVKPDIDSSARSFLDNKMKAVLADAQRVANKQAVELNLDADVSEIMETLEELYTYETEDLELGITLDRSDQEAVNAAIEALRAYNQANAIDLEVEVHIAKALAQLEFLSRKRFVEIIPKINMAAMGAAQGVLAGFTGFNIMREHTEDFIRSLTELDKALPQLAANLALISAIVPVAGFGAGALTMLIGDVAALSGLLVPGSALLAAYASSVFFLGNAFSDTHKKKYIPGITEQLSSLADTAAGDFWAVAAPSYRNFAFNTLPAVYDAAKGLNTGIAGLAGSFWDAIGAVVATDRGMGNLSQIVDNIQGGMEGLGGAFEPAIQGMLTFVRVGSSYLPGLGTAIADAAEEFDSWMQSMDESGKLGEWAEAGITSLTELGSIIGSTVGIFYSLYQIADSIGFPGLTELATGMAGLNEALQTDGAITALTNLGNAVNTAFGTIAASLSWVGPLVTQHFDGIVSTISVMGDIVGGILEGIGSALTNTGLVDAFFGLFESMNTAVQQFQPAFEAIGTIMAVTFNFLGSALENITPILTQFFVNLANDAILIKPAFMGMLDIIGEWGPRVMEIVGTVTNAVAEWFGNLEPAIALAGVALVALSPIIAGVGLAFVGAVSYISKFVGAVGKIGAAFGSTKSGAAILQGALKGVGGGIGGLLGRVTALIPGIGWIVSAFISAFAASEELRKGVGTFLANAFKTLLAFIQPLIGPIGTLFGTLMSGLEQIGSAVAPAFSGLFNALNSIMPVIQLVAHFLGAVLGGAIKNISTVLGSLINTISTVLGGVANIIGGAFNAISSVVTGVIGIIKGLITGDMSAVADAARGMWDGLKEAWGQMLGGAVQAVAGVFTGAVDLIMSSAKGMLEQVLTVFDTFDIFPAGQKIIQSLIDGFTEKISAVREWLQNLTQSIIEWKGPPANDATLLNEAGASIIQSLIDGFMSVVENVMTFLQDLTQRIVAVVMNIVTSVVTFFQTGWNVLVTIVQTVWNLIVTVIQTVLTTIITVVQTYINLVVTVFQTGWTILVTIVQTVWNLIVTVIQTVFTTIMTVIQTGVTFVTTIFQTAWNGLVFIVQTVWNAIVLTIQTVFTTIMTVVQTGITFVTTIFQTGWNALTLIVSTVFNAIILIIQSVWAGIQSVIQIGLTAIQMIFTTVWNAISLVVSTVWNGIRNTISIVINAIRTVIVTVLTGIMTVVSTVWNTIRTVTMTVWNAIRALISLGLAAIKALFTGNFAAFRAIIQTAWNVIRSTTSAVWNAIRSAISSVLSTIRSVISSVFNAIRSTISSVMNSIRSTISSVWNAIRSAISSVISSIRSIISSAWNAIRSVISSVMNSIRSIISSVWNAIRSIVSSVISSVRSAVSSGFNAIRSVVSSVMNAIRSVTSSVWNSIRSTISSVISSVRSTVSSGVNAARSAITSAWNAARSLTTSAWNAMVSAVSNAVSNLMGKVRGIPGQIRGALGNLGSLLTGAGRSIIQGLIDGVSGMIGTLKGKFSSITNMIPDWKGPPDTDAKLLTNAGELIMEGLIGGLESRYGAVKSSLQNFTGELSQTVGTQIGADVGVTTSVRKTALSDAERRLSYRSGTDSMVQSNGDGIGREVHLHFHNALVNESEIITVVNRELGRGV